MSSASDLWPVLTLGEVFLAVVRSAFQCGSKSQFRRTENLSDIATISRNDSRKGTNEQFLQALDIKSCLAKARIHKLECIYKYL